MKKRLIVALLCMLSAGINAQSYRYLKLETLRSDNHKWQEVEWYGNGLVHPSPKMTANSSNGYVVSGDGGELFKPYDGDVDTHKWIGKIDPPLSISFTLDLGAGNEIDPDSMRFIKPSYSLIYDFRVWASNNNTDWSLLLDIADLNSAGHASMTFPLEEVSDSVAPSVPGGLEILAVTNSSIAFKWIASSDNWAVSGYDVFVNDELAGTTSQTAFTASGLDQASTYEIYVVAFDESGNRSEHSDTLLSQTLLADLEAPTDPTNLVLDSSNYDKLYFSWSASTDNENLAGYMVFLDDIIAGISDNTHFAIPGLEADSLYKISIQARDLSGNLSSGIASAEFKTGDKLPERMLIGTNFWNIGWGGAANDPFTDGYQNFSVKDNPWKSEFLDETKFYSHFRFMDYIETNNTTFSHWLERTHLSDQIQNPLAYELLIDLCNRQDADLWFTVPHPIVSSSGMEGATNHFMKKLAILVKTGVDMLDADLSDSIYSNLEVLSAEELIARGGIKTCDPLDPHLKFYIEYSNETWNGSFTQFNYCVSQGGELGLDGDIYAQGRRFHAWAALRLFEAAEDVFGKDNPRLMRMDAYQAVVPSQINDHYSVYKNASLNPRGIYPDAFSPAPYFGNGADGSNPNIVEILISGSSGINARTLNLKTAREFIESEKAKGFPVSKLITYEAGQHVINNADIINRKPEMYDLYVRYLDSCNVYLDEMSHYLHTSTFSGGGTWGAKEGIGQALSSAHKYRALLDWHKGMATRPDLEPPSAPSSLSYTELSMTGFMLHWEKATDNDTVISYTVDINSSVYENVSDTFLLVSGLDEGTQYSCTVSALDRSGNISAKSSPLNITTLQAPTYTVTFLVKDKTSNTLLEGAEIALNGVSKFTDSSGEAHFVDQETGTAITYLVSLENYVDHSSEFDLIDADILVEVLMESLVGISEHNLKKGIYPNPCKEAFVLENTQSGLLEICDLNGRVISQHENYSGEKIKISDLEKGLYIVRFYSEIDLSDHVLIKE